MKKTLWIVFAAALSTSLLAQDVTNPAPVLQAPPPEPTPATTPAPTAEMPSMPSMEAPTNAPATSTKSKTTAKKKTPAKKTTTAKATTSKTAAAKKAKPAELKTVPLVPGPAVVSANHVNVRTKAGLVGEVLTHMTNGESVTVIEEIHLKKSGPDEPSAWAKVSLPPEAKVWIKTSLLGSDNTINIKRANLRGGPGEAYGVVGTVEKGAAITTIEAKGEWTQIQAPTNAYAFMAAQYLKQGGEEMAANTAAMPTTTPEAAPATTAMPDMPAVAPATSDAPTTAATTPGMPNMPTTDTTPAPPIAEPTMTPATQEPPPERIVEHEGIVRGSFSIQAPTKFQLVSPDTKVPINYLYTPSTNLDLSRYKGMHIIVTGEEGLDERWKNTPVITIQKIQVLD